MLKKEKSNITNRIKNYMSNVTIDVFGIEKKAQSNVLSYFEETSKSEDIPMEQLSVLINLRHSLRVYLVSNGAVLREIPVKNLVIFFAGSNQLGAMDLTERVTSSVIKFLQQYSFDRKMATAELYVRITNREGQARVIAYKGVQELQEIAIKELIKYFK